MTRADVTVLLRTVAAHGLPGSPEGTLGRPLDADQWQGLLAQVHRERIIPLLAQAIADGSFPATDAQAMEIVGLDTEAMAAVLTLEATLLGVAEDFNRVGIHFRVLKGPAVAHLDYSSPSLRDFGDIDLLIHPDDLDVTITMLAEQGYVRRFPEPRAGFDRRFAKSVSMVNPDGLELDLHRTLAAGVFGLRVDVGLLWDAPPAHFALGGLTLRALGSAERFIHACYHAALGNAPPRLVPQRDIAQMLLRGSVDPDRVLSLAAAWQGEAVVAHAITTAWTTLRMTHLGELSAWAAKYTTQPRQQRELARATSAGYSYTAKALDAVRAIRPARDRLVYVSALAFPRRSYLNGRHSGFAARVGHAVSELVAARTYGRQPTPPTADAGRFARSNRRGEP
jgi:Uncharacterised nucleotidyltransferase